jgi:hypothetical protein
MARHQWAQAAVDGKIDISIIEESEIPRLLAFESGQLDYIESAG